MFLLIFLNEAHMQIDYFLEGHQPLWTRAFRTGPQTPDTSQPWPACQLSVAMGHLPAWSQSLCL